jgi:hypothetical protein
MAATHGRAAHECPRRGRPAMFVMLLDLPHVRTIVFASQDRLSRASAFWELG